MALAGSVRAATRSAVAGLVVGAVLASGGCALVRNNASGHEAERALEGLAGVHDVHAVSGSMNGPSSLDISLDEDVTAAQVAALARTLTTLKPRRVSEDWTSVNMRVTRPNGTRHPDQVQGATTYCRPQFKGALLLQRWLSEGDLLESSVNYIDMDPEGDLRPIVLADDQDALDRDKAVARRTPGLQDATLRLRQGNDDLSWIH